MITYRSLSRTPGAFRSLCGLSVPEFDALCREWVHADSKARASSTHTREDPHPRQRAVGAGRKWDLDVPTRLLAALVWLKVYPTWEVLGFLFGIDESVARRSTRDVLAVLEEIATFPLEKRTGRPRGRNLAQVIESCPAVEVIVDAKEQRIRRPTGWEEQRPFYSGKKKTHTLKVQAAVSVEGRVQALSASVPGSMHDLTLLRRSGLIERLEPDEGVGADKAYRGIERDHPEHAFDLPYKGSKHHPLSNEEKSYNRALASVRIAVEHLFARMNRFGALAQVFRHQRACHTGVVRVAAWLADRQLAALQGDVCPVAA